MLHDPTEVKTTVVH